MGQEKRKLFGTDGIRGKANVYPMNCEVAMALGRAVTNYFRGSGPNRTSPLILLGKDTRLSCYMLELAFSAGVCSQGGRVVLTGPLPTPGVAFATVSMRANAGVMISASHNIFSDNGIKIFDGQGNKLPDEIELELEKMVFDQSLIPNLPSSELGRAKRLDEVLGRYIVHVKSSFDSRYDLSGMRIVLDCANGAGYKVAPMILEELGAEVFALGVNPNGQNINVNCGSVHPEKAQEDVRKYKADLGICLDGDGDRLILIDHKGDIVDGDKIIGLLAKLMKDKGDLEKGDEVIGTVMSNIGLELFIKGLGLTFYRAKVGDRYIAERMWSSKAILGGEPSGHIIIGPHSSTGDGILSALKMIEAIKYYKKNLSELVADITLCPQILTNIEVKSKPPLETIPKIQEAVKKAEDEMKGRGRVLLRYSGTESLLRLMIEGENEKTIQRISDEMAKVLRDELGA